MDLQHPAPLSEQNIKQNHRSEGGEILRGSTWLWLQEAADMLLAFAFAWFALRRLGPGGFGSLTLTQAILNISGLATLNIELTVVRYIPEFRSKGHWRTARFSTYLITLVKVCLATVAAVVLFIAAPFVANFYQNTELIPALRVGCLSLFAAALVDVGAAICLSLFHPEIRTAMTTIRRLCEITGLLIITGLGYGFVHAVGVLAIADSIAALGYTVAAIHFLKRDPKVSGEPLEKLPLIKILARYSIPLMGARLTEVTGREIGKLLLARLASPIALGYYAIARLAAERLIALLSQSPLAALPVLSGSHARETFDGDTTRSTSQAVLQLLNYQMIAAGLIGIGISVLAPLFVRLVGGPDYIPAIPVVRTVGYTVFLWSGIASIHALLLVLQRPAGIFYLNLANIGVTAIAYGLLTPRWQATGTGLADSLGQLAIFGFALFLAQAWFHFDTLVARRNAIQIGIPALVLTLPLWFLNLSYPLLLIILFIDILFYGTYLLRLGYIDTRILKNLEWVALNPPILNQAKNGALHLILGYQNIVVNLSRK